MEEKQEKIENKDEDNFDDETKKNIEFQKRIEGWWLKKKRLNKNLHYDLIHIMYTI